MWGRGNSGGRTYLYLYIYTLDFAWKTGFWFERLRDEEVKSRRESICKYRTIFKFIKGFGRPVILENGQF